MASQRPNFIDLRSKSQASVSRPLRSPRLHVAGEIPPELSPLDAFALQSRLLAKQLEESAKRGRRMSRLPPLTADSPLIVQGRSDYFRSMSQDSASEDGDHGAHHAPQNVGLGLKTEVNLEDRPKSVHPHLSHVPPTTDESVPLPAMPSSDSWKGGQANDAGATEGFFGVGARREQSPSPMEPGVQEKQAETKPTAQDGAPHQSPRPSSVVTSSPERAPKNSFDAAGLVPPRPLFTKRSSSLMSSPLESTDEEGVSTLGTSIHSQSSRKLSSSSGAFSPACPPFQRSPSVASDASGLPRPQFNFSRPMSRAGTPIFDAPARQLSSDSHASLPAEDPACTPRSTTSEASREALTDDGGPSAGPSSVSSKFTFPRGKQLPRSSIMIPHDERPGTSSEQTPVSPTSNSQSFPATGNPPPSGEPTAEPSQERSESGTDLPGPSQQPSQQPSKDGSPVLGEDQKGRDVVAPPRDITGSGASVSAATSDSASTIKESRPQNTPAPTSSDMSAEEHVNKAIALHEGGSLQESTWHLRLAAKQGHPTGMLLYALACRHGWGMRPNPREGVQWLRKAAEAVNPEMQDEEGQAKGGKAMDVAERKARKAQFALSIYELGVSHMNGWGIEQDKALALRCFEIAACKSYSRPVRFESQWDAKSATSLGRRRCACRGGLLLRSGHWVQEGSQEERQVLPRGRG